jgi:hypothetical protein
MSDDRNKPGVAFWATVALVVVLVGYPLSFGPVCWLSSRSEIGPDNVSAIYQPMLHLSFCGPSLVRRSLCWYAWLRARENWTVAAYGDGTYHRKEFRPTCINERIDFDELPVRAADQSDRPSNEPLASEAFPLLNDTDRKVLNGVEKHIQ